MERNAFHTKYPYLAHIRLPCLSLNFSHLQAPILLNLMGYPTNKKFHVFELLFTSYNQESILAVIHHEPTVNHPTPHVCCIVFDGSAWVSLIGGRGWSERYIDLVVIGVALELWEVSYIICKSRCFFQHRTKAGPCGILIANLIFSERLPVICNCCVLWDLYDVNHV